MAFWEWMGPYYSARAACPHPLASVVVAVAVAAAVVSSVVGVWVVAVSVVAVVWGEGSGASKGFSVAPWAVLFSELSGGHSERLAGALVDWVWVDRTCPTWDSRRRLWFIGETKTNKRKRIESNQTNKPNKVGVVANAKIIESLR